MTRARSWSFAAALAASLVAVAARPAAADDKAIALVERMHRVMHGADAPYRVQSIAFTFAVDSDGKRVVSRRHRWEPPTGNHHLEGTTREGQPYVIDWNLNSRAGTASRGGTPLAGDDLTQMLEIAWRTWVNDTYWLLMPYKLRDPGVHLSYHGPAEADGKTYDVIKVTFDQVGLTPGDTYWAYLAPDTGLMERWSYVLQGEQPPPQEFRWLGWAAHGPLVLADRKESVPPGRTVLTTDIEVR